MFKKPFVVLDIETTGFVDDKDEIIEVACIRYEEGKEVARYSSLVFIEKKIPPIVSLITNIRNEDLTGAPLWDEVKPLVQKIVQGAFVVGHNVPFDAGFLRKKGIDFGSSLFLDTLSLAQIAFPYAGSFSLESLTDQLDIGHENRHRAMSDTEATLVLFKKVWENLNGLPALLLTELQDLIRRTDSSFQFFFDELRGVREADGSVNFSNPVGSSDLSGQKILSTSEGVSRSIPSQDVFAPGGLLSQIWDHYEARPQQNRMSGAVAHAFANNYHLICEAPTGVGKSLAYLVPAAEMALGQKRRVVISTHTLALQQQLFDKDLEHLKKIYEHGTHNGTIPVAVLKGRGNYLCIQRLHEFKKRASFSPVELLLLLKILTFPFLNKKGDLADLSLSQEERVIWNLELSAESKSRFGGRCCKNPECFFQKACQAAQDASIVIVNHALLVADLVLGGGLLPDYEYLVIDEAHQFEEVVTRGYGKALTQESLAIPIKAVYAHLNQLQRQTTGTLFSQQSFFTDLPALTDQVTPLLQKTDNLFSVVSLFVSSHVPPSDYAESLLVDRLILGLEEWVNLGESVQTFFVSIHQWLTQLDLFLQRLEAQDFPDHEDFILELGHEIAVIREQLTILRTFFMEDETQRIRFLTTTNRGVVTLSTLPLLAGEPLMKDLYEKKKSIILTSATLSTPLVSEEHFELSQKPFEYLRKMLNLNERFEELVLDSPFDFEKQALVILPKDMNVRHHDSLEQIITLIHDVVLATQGRMLGLFTSYKVIENLFVRLLPLLSSKGINVLAQRFSGGRNKILRSFLNDPANSLLLGTSSFWEGIDIPGDDLIAVLIHKLPFDIPSDPLHKARCQLFQNGFYEYTVPRAILKLKQGFGRLIRSKQDYGVMILLDDALTKKDYGPLFLKSLPHVTIERVEVEGVAPLIRQWLSFFQKR